MKNYEALDIDHVQTITGETKNYALVGPETDSAWHPRIYNAFFSHFALDAVYTALPACSEPLAGFFPFLRHAYHGVNLLSPYALEALPMMDTVDAEAKAIGAVNMVHFQDEKAVGYNTDAKGFQYALLSAGIKPEGMQVAVLGGGYMARVITYMLHKLRAQVAVYTRNPRKADDLRALGALDVRPLTRFVGGFDMLVNATPIGAPPMLQNIPVSVEGIRSCGIIYDTIYNPLRSMYLRQALGPAYNGLSMLVYQAAHSLEIWSGKLASKELIAQAAGKLEDLLADYRHG